MADIMDVTNALAALIADHIYPNGTSQPSAVGVPVRIVEGWPVTEVLNGDLAAGNVQISVFPRSEERNTTRFPTKEETISITAPTLSAVVLGDTVAFYGTTAVPQYVVVNVGGASYPYQVATTDTLDGIAAGIAALIPGAASAGAVVTIPGAAKLSANISTQGQSSKEVKRQERVIQITVWAPSPTVRDQVTGLIDPQLADTPRLPLADQSTAQLVYKSSPITDQLQKSRIFRRDLLYQVEFGTTKITTDTAIGGFNVDIQPSFAATF